MAQFSVKIMRLTGSVLGENQQSKLTETAKTELVSAAPQFPTWLARLVGEMVHG